jgi:hypothetical protein
MDTPPPEESQAVLNEIEAPVPQEEEAPGAQAAKSEVKLAIKWVQWGVVIAGVLVALIFLGLLVLYFKLDDIHETTKATAMTLRETAVRDERAWVAPVSIDSHLAAGSPISISIKIVNSGKTFAKKCQIDGACRILPYPSVPDMATVNSKSSPPSSDSFFIAPGLPFTVPAAVSPSTMGQGTFDNLQSGKERIFLFGRIGYDDIFNKHHWIEYCYHFDPKKSQWIESGDSNTDEK